MTIRLSKAIRRRVKIHAVDYEIELAPGGVMFRRVGYRQRVVAPIAAVLDAVNDFSKVQARREFLRAQALERAQRAPR